MKQGGKMKQHLAGQADRGLNEKREQIASKGEAGQLPRDAIREKTRRQAHTGNINARLPRKGLNTVL